MRLDGNLCHLLRAHWINKSMPGSQPHKKSDKFMFLFLFAVLQQDHVQ